MSNAIIPLIIFSISFLEAHNFERIDLVLSNAYVFKRVKPNDQIILNGVQVLMLYGDILNLQRPMKS